MTPAAHLGGVVTPIDPFDLPEWLGESEVTWTPDVGIASAHRVPGCLSAGAHVHECDLFAVDEAYPAPVADSDLRHTAHQAWRLGQVHLASYDDRLTLLVPGTRFDADLAMEVVGRFAKAIGAVPGHFAVHLRLDL